MSAPWPTAHRPWSLPAGPWIMRQTWRELLFAHWPVPAAVLRPLLPPPLELDTFDGEAWLGVVPFHMTDVSLRALPALPGLSAFPELNLRTYVRHGGKPGVWFLALDCASRVAVEVARAWFRLPYFHARMAWSKSGDELTYASRRTDRRCGPGELRLRYRPTGPVLPPQQRAAGELAHWLTERYCLYASGRRGRLVRGEIHHAPWPLQPAEAEFERNEVGDAFGIRLPDRAPLLHFAERLDVRVWNPVLAARGIRAPGTHR